MTNILNDTRRAEFFARVNDLGEAEGRGIKSRPDFAIGMFLAAADQLIVSNVKEQDKDDVRTLVLNFFTRRGVISGDKPKPDSITQQESKLRSFPNIGGLPMFRSSRNGGNTIARDWIALVQARIAALAEQLDEAQPLLDKMTLVNTAQKKKVEAGSEQPLTATEIDAAIAPKAKDLSELKDLKKIEKNLIKLGKDWPLALPTVALALGALAPRMATLAGVEKAKGLKATLESMTTEQLELAGIAPVQPEQPAAKPVQPAPVATLVEAAPEAEKPKRNRRKAESLSELSDLVTA